MALVGQKCDTVGQVSEKRLYEGNDKAGHLSDPGVPGQGSDPLQTCGRTGASPPLGGTLPVLSGPRRVQPPSSPSLDLDFAKTPRAGCAPFSAPFGLETARTMRARRGAL